MSLGRAFVGPFGVFSPGFRGIEAWRGGEPDPGAMEPSADFLSVRLRRGASPLTRMFVDVSAQVFAESGIDPASVRLVFGTAFGEVDTALRLIADQDPVTPRVSPARFKSSVSNTATGLLSIETGNRLAATTIAAGYDTFAMTLVEALSTLASDPTPVLFAVADEAVPPALYFGETYSPFAFAFLITRAPIAGSRARLDGIVRQADSVTSSIPPPYHGSPLAAALPLLSALAAGSGPRRVPIGGAASTLSVELTFGEDAS